jgi:ABC-2 type transport system ATP-binding protein
MAEADALCERLVIIDRGEAIALDIPENLKSGLGRDIITLETTPPIGDPGELATGLGVQSATNLEPNVLRLEVLDAQRIVGELVARVSKNHRLESAHIARPSLDDVFLHYTGRALRE